MEFKFRAGDNRPPVCFSPSSSIGYFYEQALRGPCNFLLLPSFFLNLSSYPNADPRQIPEPMRNELILRRIEKERIREEIIAQEMAWRRELEAEVRRELMVEREMAMRGGRGMSFEERLTMQFDSRKPLLPGPFVNQFDYSWPEDRLAFHGHGVSYMLPPVPRLPESEMKPSTENNKDKVIVLVSLIKLLLMFLVFISHS
ncbi:hypothetical protein POTOM_025832 [Populus tomentosa]|uniref:Uncharacterized protein n=1 Tax=Populus tomentosa TaxID=118781 RepID=A0A8X7ZJT4_POPTO|nr:hypothetical protein POTOM_025832 [Populus tomentosa]